DARYGLAAGRAATERARGAGEVRRRRTLLPQGHRPRARRRSQRFRPQLVERRRLRHPDGVAEADGLETGLTPNRRAPADDAELGGWVRLICISPGVGKRLY